MDHVTLISRSTLPGLAFEIQSVKAQPSSAPIPNLQNWNYLPILQKKSLSLCNTLFKVSCLFSNRASSCGEAMKKNHHETPTDYFFAKLTWRYITCWNILLEACPDKDKKLWNLIQKCCKVWKWSSVCFSNKKEYKDAAANPVADVFAQCTPLQAFPSVWLG